MIVRALDSAGDWTFGKGFNNYKSGNDATAQNIQTRLMSFFGDCFFDQGAGIDWFNLLGSKNQLALNFAVSSTILSTQNVTGLLLISMNLNSSRQLMLKYKAATVSGNVAANQLFDPTSFLLTEAGNILLTESGAKISIEGT